LNVKKEKKKKATWGGLGWARDVQENERKKTSDSVAQRRGNTQIVGIKRSRHGSRGILSGKGRGYQGSKWLAATGLDRKSSIQIQPWLARQVVRKPKRKGVNIAYHGTCRLKGKHTGDGSLGFKPKYEEVKISGKGG